MRIIPRKRPATGLLARHLADPEAFLGALTNQGYDLAEVLAQEGDVNTLDLAVARAIDSHDRRWAIEVLRRRLAVRKSPEVGLKLANLLSDALRGPEAQAVLDRLPKRGSKFADDIRQAQAKAAISRAEFDLARDLLDASAEDPVPVLAALLRDYILRLLSCGHYDRATAEAARLRDQFPTIHSVAEAQAEVLSVVEGAEAALAYLAATPLLKPDRLEYQRLHARILAQMGRHLECLGYVKTCIEAAPDRFPLYDLARHAALLADRFDDFDVLVEKGSRLFPNTLDMLEIRCAWLAEQDGLEQAKALLPEIRARSEWAFQTLSLMIACQGSDLDAAFEALDQCVASGLRHGWSEFVLINHLYFHHGTPAHIAQARTMLEGPMPNLQSRSIAQRTYFRLLIAMGDLDTLRRDFAALPKGLAQSADLTPIALYLKALAGEDEAARQGWQQFMATSSHPALNARSQYPVELSLKYREAPGDVLVFVTIFNGIEFVDWFLEYYRTLGVVHFFFTDNGSDDGTLEKLLEQPDVSVFQAVGSFSAAACGVFWANHLMRRFGVGHWCLHLDMDEAFVFPEMEARLLSDLLAYLDAQGYGAMQGTMVDMYPSALDPSSGGDPFAQSCYFDSDYHTMPVEFPPYLLVQGGLRARLSGRSLMMNKAPLVKMQSDTCYILNNHYHTHLPVADISCAVLHYKFVGDILARIDEAIERKEHFMGSRFYKALRGPLEQADGSQGFLSRFSVQYTSPRSLVEHDLMQSSAKWQSFRAR